MKSTQLIMALLAGIFSLSLAQAQEDKPDKIGTVDMRQLLQDYYKMAETIEAFKGYRDQVEEQNQERIKVIKDLVDTFRELEKQAEKATAKEKQQELYNQMQSKQREAQARGSERLGWLERKNAAFKEKENIELGKLREEILDAVREIGKEEGYDFIFDRSGASGANVLILAYAKDATDLTALVLERINRDAPKKDKDQEDPKEGE